MVTLPLAPSLVPLSALGLIGVGMASWLDGDDEGETADAEDDEDFGMEDDFEVDDFDDDFGGMDDMEGGGEASVTELEGRIEELENEIANVSSTANTVRSENEQISEQVDEVQENVRKLLEIYEMVTRGVNPFVDDVSGDMGMGGGGGGGFGLFDDADTDDADESEEELDEDLAGADAEDFFDDDAFDEVEDEGGDFESEFEEESGDLENELEEEGGDFESEFEDDVEEMGDMDDFDMDEENTTEEESGGGTSFEELKEEYESGDADWAEEDAETDGEDEFEEDMALDEGGESSNGDDATIADEDDEELFQEDDLIEEDEETAEAAETADEEDLEGDVVEPEGEAGDGATAEAQAQSESTGQGESQGWSAPGTGETIGGFQFGTAGAAETGDGPYLSAPPDGYLADVVVLEWMNYLLSEFDARNTVRSINYYQRIGWIGPDMRDFLIQVLMGLTDSDYLYRDEFGTTDLTMSDHMKSLEYIEELSSGNLDRKIADRLETLSS